MISKIWSQKFWRKVAGVVLIILGIIGLFLPFLQGVAMILAGLALLENKQAALLFEKIKAGLHKRFRR